MLHPAYPRPQITQSHDESDLSPLVRWWPVPAALILGAIAGWFLPDMDVTYMWDDLHYRWRSFFWK